MKLQSKKALVSGATRGIGRAIAEKLLEEGSAVSISARHQPDIQRTLKELGARGRITGQTCDVRSAEQVKDWIEAAAEELGGIDFLINNAGVGIFKEVGQMSVEEWDSVIETNLNSLFYTCHFALPHLRQSQHSFIINIGSLAGKNAFPKGSAYNASKFGLIGFSEALMQEVRYEGIRVAYIMPGSVDTGFAGSQTAGQAAWKIGSEDIAELVVETLARPARSLTSRIEIRPSQPPRG